LILTGDLGFKFGEESPPMLSPSLDSSRITGEL
jgi:hypothetical protein